MVVFNESIFNLQKINLNFLMKRTKINLMKIYFHFASMKKVRSLINKNKIFCN